MASDTVMLRLGFDLDGVLADFRTAFLQEAAHVLGTNGIEGRGSAMPDFDSVSADESRQVWKSIVARPNWWIGLNAYEPEQISRLYQLTRERKWEISFLTTRIPTAGDSVQFQSQTWLETLGFYMPAVVTVPGSRGEIANGLRLDVVIDDQLLNCLEVVGASQTKAMLMLQHEADAALERQATERGIAVVWRLEEVIDALPRLEKALTQKRGVLRLADWFGSGRKRSSEPTPLPMNPRGSRPIPR